MTHIAGEFLDQQKSLTAETTEAEGRGKMEDGRGMTEQ